MTINESKYALPNSSKNYCGMLYNLETIQLPALWIAEDRKKIRTKKWQEKHLVECSIDDRSKNDETCSLRVCQNFPNSMLVISLAISLLIILIFASFLIARKRKASRRHTKKVGK
jgi:hypothetical protein